MAPRPATGAAVDLLGQLAEHQKRAAEISQELAQILEVQLADSGPVERACPTPEMDPFLSANDLARRLSVSPTSIRRWRREGKLPPGIDLGGVVRWRSEAIDAWIAEHEEPDR